MANKKSKKQSPPTKSKGQKYFEQLATFLGPQAQNWNKLTPEQKKWYKENYKNYSSPVQNLPTAKVHPEHTYVKGLMEMENDSIKRYVNSQDYKDYLEGYGINAERKIREINTQIDKPLKLTAIDANKTKSFYNPEGYKGRYTPWNNTISLDSSYLAPENIQKDVWKEITLPILQEELFHRSGADRAVSIKDQLSEYSENKKLLKAQGSDVSLGTHPEYLARPFEHHAKKYVTRRFLADYGLPLQSNPTQDDVYNTIGNKRLDESKLPKIAQEYLFNYTYEPYKNFYTSETMGNKSKKTKKKCGGKLHREGGGPITPSMFGSVAQILPGIIGGLPGKEGAPGSGGDLKDAASVMAAAGGIASLFPGVGTAIGAGLNIAAPLVNEINVPSNYIPMGENQGKYSKAMGGKLNPLSSSTVEVQANNPSLTDSVELPQAYVDHGETISQLQYGGGMPNEKYVFSDSLTMPGTNKTFADLDKELAKADGKAEELPYDEAAKNTLKYHGERREKTLMPMNEKLRTLVEMTEQGKERMKNGGPMKKDLVMYGKEYKGEGAKKSNVSVWDAVKMAATTMPIGTTGRTFTQNVGDAAEAGALMLPASKLGLLAKLGKGAKWKKYTDATRKAFKARDVKSSSNYTKLFKKNGGKLGYQNGGPGPEGSPPEGISPEEWAAINAYKEAYTESFLPAARKYLRNNPINSTMYERGYGSDINARTARLVTIPNIENRAEHSEMLNREVYSTPADYMTPLRGQPYPGPTSYIPEEISQFWNLQGPNISNLDAITGADPNARPNPALGSFPIVPYREGQDPNAKILADAWRAQGSQGAPTTGKEGTGGTGKKEPVSAIDDPNFTMDDPFDPYADRKAMTRDPFYISDGLRAGLNRNWRTPSSELQAGIDAGKIPGVPGKYGAGAGGAQAGREGIFGNMSEGERLQWLESISKAGSLLQGYDQQTLYQNTAPITRQEFDPQNALMQQQYAANAARQGLQGSGTGASLQANLQNLAANQMRAGAQVQTQYDQMNKQAQTQYEQRLAQRQQENIGYKYATDQVRQQDEAAYWNQFRDVLTGIGNLGREKVAVEENEKAVRLLINAYPDITPYLQSMGVDLSKFITKENKKKG